MLKGGLALDELEEIQEEAKKKSKRRNNKRWQLQRGGVLGVREARDLTNTREVLEQEKEQRAACRRDRAYCKCLISVYKYTANKGRAAFLKKQLEKQQIGRELGVELAARSRGL